MRSPRFASRASSLAGSSSDLIPRRAGGSCPGVAVAPSPTGPLRRILDRPAATRPARRLVRDRLPRATRQPDGLLRMSERVTNGNAVDQALDALRALGI